GGGVYQIGASLTLRRTAIDGCSAEYGGGVELELGASLSLEDSTISGCTGVNGGGLFAQSAQKVEIVRSTITGNHALYGGGIFNYQDTSIECTIGDSTIEGNTAADYGGGIYNGTGDTTHLYSTTVANNQADSNLDGIGTGGGVYNAGTFTFLATILS